MNPSEQKSTVGLIGEPPRFSRLLHMMGGVVLALAGWLMTTPLRSAMDIFFLDETGYLIRGMNMFPKIPKLWGPVYCFWYKILSIVQSNPVDLFYLNYGLISVLTALVLYIFLLRFRVMWPVAIWLSFMVLIAPFNLTTFPKVAHFAAIFGMTGIMVAYFIRHHQNRYLFIALLFLVMSYIRPEFYLSFLICSIGIFVGWALKKIRFEGTAMLIGVAILVALLHIGLGMPLGVEMRGYKRSFIAFGEHFSWNFSKWNEIDGYLWLTWESVTSSHFGESDSFLTAFLANPSMMFKHIFYNLGIYIQELENTLAMSVLPVKTVSVVVRYVIPIAIMGLLLIASVRRDFVKRIIHHRALGVFLFLMALPSILSCLLVFPRGHYIIIQLPLMIWLLAELLSTGIRKLSSNRVRMGSIAVLTLLASLYFFDARRPADYTYFEMRKTNGKLNNLNLLDFLAENQQLLDGKRLLSHEGNFSAFTNTDIEFVNALDKGTMPFDEFLATEQPDLIYCTQTIFNNPNYLQDEDWEAFVEQEIEQSVKWRVVSVDGGEQDFLLVRPEIFDDLNLND